MANDAAGSYPGEAELRNIISQVANEEINKALVGWSKRELPKTIQSMQDQLSEAFLERLSQELPSEDEIDQMELEEFVREAEANGMTPEDYASALEAAALEEQGYQPQPGGGRNQQMVDPRTNGQLLELRRAAEKTARELEAFKTRAEEAERRAEETERFSTIRSHLAELPWRQDSEKGKDVAFEYVKARAKRSDDGSIVIDDLPAKQWVETNGPDLFGGFFQPKPAQGAGAFSPGYSAKGKGPDTDQIRSGMSNDDKIAVAHAALGALGQLPGSI